MKNDSIKIEQSDACIHSALRENYRTKGKIMIIHGGPRKNMNTAVYTMNATTEQAPTTPQGMKNVEWVLGTCLGCEVKVVQANQTKQVKDYSRYQYSESMAQSHDKWHNEHFTAGTPESLRCSYLPAYVMAQTAICSLTSS